MIIEDQSSLRAPSGPCGAEFLLSGGAHGVVLQHAAGREFFEGGFVLENGYMRTTDQPGLGVRRL
jgi:uncharacterized NAD-dependent epimerase/dehydratase family protein